MDEYDVILIVYSNKRHQNDVEIAEQLAKVKKPFWRSIFDIAKAVQDLNKKNWSHDGPVVDEVRK